LTLADCTALEIGSRHGGLSLWLALCGATVVCSDLDGPTDAAKQKHARYGVSDRVTYEQADARRLPYERTFDLIVFKSVLGGVASDRAQQRLAVGQMYRALKPGGELWFAENLVASPLHRCLRTRCLSWGRRWRYVSIGDLIDFLSPFAAVHLDASGVLGAFGRTEQQRSILSRADRLLMNAIVPAAWRYIAIGVASR
jgi:SAM-dependent methyltransferase